MSNIYVNFNSKQIIIDTEPPGNGFEPVGEFHINGMQADDVIIFPKYRSGGEGLSADQIKKISNHFLKNDSWIRYVYDMNDSDWWPGALMNTVQSQLTRTLGRSVSKNVHHDLIKYFTTPKMKKYLVKNLYPLKEKEKEAQRFFTKEVIKALRTIKL